MILNIFATSLILFLSIYFTLKKFNFLIDKKDLSFHKKLVIFSKKPILMGGIYLCIIVLFFFPNNFIYLKIITVLILLVGLLSDIGYLNSPLKRILIQFALVLFLVLVDKIFIRSLSLDFLDNILKIEFINILLTIFCFLVLVNGTNFLDGLNSLVSGYYIIIILCLLFLSQQNSINLFYEKEILYFFIGLFIFFIFNIFGLTFLGDGGAYIIGLLIGYILIYNFNLNTSISPYYVALLLWYPAFENLFSLSRRIFLHKKVSMPDNLHLHQLIYLKIKKKLIKDEKIINSSSSLFILSYNLIILAIGTNYYNSTKILVGLILINLLFYCFLYYFFSKNSVQYK